MLEANNFLHKAPNDLRPESVESVRQDLSVDTKIIQWQGLQLSVQSQYMRMIKFGTKTDLKFEFLRMHSLMLRMGPTCTAWSRIFSLKRATPSHNRTRKKRHLFSPQTPLIPDLYETAPIPIEKFPPSSIINPSQVLIGYPC